ncbi:hypothetical protein J057_01650 [Marinobacter nanhaiticus D15-8W]|uniref:Uncharacterized protein n=1 Tax=Marinobacter nanhaiticus D15-8W TaxID=626887 RepID=N6W315_9GAMM|nr:hypothetical protein J057_01650 [Marinobacter nanhaiticus D15-8W]
MGARPIAQSSRGVTRVRTGAIESATADFGNQVADLGQEIQRRNDVEKVSQAITQFEDEQRQYLVEGEDAVLNRSGDRAKGALKSTEDWWESTSNKYVADLDNPAQQRTFQETLRRQRQSVLNTVARHESKQSEIAFGNTLEARISTATDRAAALPASPEIVNQSKAEVLDALSTLGKSRGWSPEVMQAKRAETLSNFHGRQIEALIDDNPDAAETYFKANQGDMTAAARAKIESTIESETIRRRSQGMADSIMNEGLGAEDSLKRARGIRDPKVRDEVVSRIRSRLNERESFAKNERSKLLLQVTNFIEETGSIDNVPAEIWGSLSVTERNRFQKYAEDISTGRPVKTDWNVFYDLSQMRAENPGEFRNTDLSPYFRKLGDAERKQVIGWQSSLLEGERNAGEEAWVQTKTSIVNEALTSMGVDYGKTAGQDEAKRAASFRGAVENQLSIWQSENPGRKIPPDEFRRIVDRQTISVTLPDRGIFGRDIEAPLFEAESAPDWYFSGDADDLPEQDRFEIESALEAQGLTPTPELILEIYIKANDLNRPPAEDEGE